MHFTPVHAAFCALGFLLLAPRALCAAAFVKNDPAAAFSELKLRDAANDNRSWRAAREDWEGARKRVADDPAWAKWLAGERAAVDRWMARHRDRVEWIAGWSHDGVSPKDASPVRWTDKIPGEETDRFSSASDPRVEITPTLKAWWVVGFRGRHNDMMNRAARLYKLTGERRYAEWAASQLDFYADNFLRWEPQRKGHQARLYWQTLTEASNLITYTDTARLLGDFPAPERLAKWRARFFYPEVEAINSNFQSIHNIATWQRCAAAQVALLFGDEAMWRKAIDGTFGVRAQIAQGITGDYIWHEQSLGYNSYVVQAVLTLFTSASLHGRAEALDHEMTVAQNLMLSTTAMRFSDGFIPNPADTRGRLTAPNAGNFAAAYRIFPTALGLATAAKRRAWDTLLDPPARVAKDFGLDLADRTFSREKLPPVRSQNMESSRMAILRKGPWQVYFHYGQLTRSHAQSEALNYELYHNATDISHDTGTVGYGSPLHRGYYTQGANHNVPLIDGEGQDLAVAFPRPVGKKAKQKQKQAQTQPQTPSLALGRLLDYAPGSATEDARVSAAQDHYRKNAAITRTLEIKDGNFVDTVTIKTTDGKPHALGLALQLQGKVKLASGFASVDDFAKGRPEVFKRWRGTRAADFMDHAALEVEYPGGTRMMARIALPGKFRIYHGNTPDVPPKRRETVYIEQQGTQATITTTFATVKMD